MAARGCGRLQGRRLGPDKPYNRWSGIAVLAATVLLAAWCCRLFAAVVVLAEAFAVVVTLTSRRDGVEMVRLLSGTGGVCLRGPTAAIRASREDQGKTPGGRCTMHCDNRHLWKHHAPKALVGAISNLQIRRRWDWLHTSPFPALA